MLAKSAFDGMGHCPRFNEEHMLAKKKPRSGVSMKPSQEYIRAVLESEEDNAGSYPTETL